MLQKLTYQAHKTSHNFVLSAPTSAGKTTVFELAFLRMVKEWDGYPDKRLAIYIAPTKVCSICFFP
jgi:ATP-dependent DNA helicase HFM1/MER3